MSEASKIKVFNEKRKKLLDLLDQTKKVSDVENVDSIVLEEIKNKIIENIFSIIVVGEFSSGKSTFINSLLREKVLPAKVLPTTAIINIIEDGEPEAIVHYKDGNINNINIEDIQSFATALNEKGKQEAALIDHMLIKYPCEYTKEGVRIIDTPGVEDLDKQREEITYNMIPKSDAAILLLDARRPLKNSERIFLKEKILGNNINKLFIVMNFIDCINDSAELNNVMKSTYENLKQITDKVDLKFYGISAKKALLESKSEEKTGYSEKLKEFEDDLQQFLIEEKGDTLINNSNNRIKYFIEDLAIMINFKINALSKPLEELKAKEQELNSVIKKIQEEKLLIKQEVNKAFNEILVRVQPNIEGIVSNAINHVESQECNDIKDIETYLNTKFKDFLLKELEGLSKGKIEPDIKEIVGRTENKLISLMKDLDDFINVDFAAQGIASDNIAADVYADDDAVVRTQLAMGIGAYFAVPLLLKIITFGAVVGAVWVIPVVLVGYFLSGMAIVNIADKYLKKKAIIKGLRGNKNNIIENIEKQIRENITGISKEYSIAIENMVSTKINDTKNSLSEVIKEKEKLTVEEESFLKAHKDSLFNLESIKQQLM
ncbi:dynamin family protein [Clostridiales bacterium oral taxon 876 str. F0540]|nr:dynamin family protein [Clostridiales bacterium oral taxon 876 str. F0540]